MSDLANLRTLRDTTTDPALRASLDAAIAALEQQSTTGITYGTNNQIDRVTTGDVAGRDLHKPTHGQASPSGPVQGAVVGVSSGTINLFFGGQPGEDGARLLADYLDCLATDCQRLRLHRLTGKRQSGNEQRSEADGLRLQDVFTSLTTDGPDRPTVRARARSAVAMRRLLKRLSKADRSSESVPPEQVRHIYLERADPTQGPKYIRRGIAALLEQPGADFTTPTWHMEFSEDATPEDLAAALPKNAPVRIHLTRPELVLEAMQRERRLVLLGEPGAGKSTALRYLALLLGKRARGASVGIPGWPPDDTPVPLVLPLGQVAAALKAGAGNAYTALLQVLHDVLEGGVREGLGRFLTPALRAGGVLLLCDGLDELPARSEGGALAPRVVVAAALRRLARETNARMVVTSRVLPYRAPGDWKLLPEDGWQQRTVQPLAFGQTRAFVQGWYAALGQHDPDLAGTHASARADALLAELAATERLRPLVRSPLLLTMLAILHYNTGDVPRDRVKLYEECVLLLLERWEPQRQPDTPRESLAERLGLPSLDPLRQVIHALAYAAQRQPPGDDGRGLLDGDLLHERMFTLFRRLGSLAEAETRVTTFLTLLREDDSGLLQLQGDEVYALPHLTVQEYLAACHLADTPQMVDAAYTHWCSDDRERWREVLLLLMGRLHQQGKAEEKGLPWLKRLLAARLGQQPKDAAQRRRDTVLAALSYAELQTRGAFAGSLLDVEAELEAPVRRAIVDLLATPDSAIATDERLAVADILATLGDPRFPIADTQWHDELAHRNERFGQPAGYWCYLPQGNYTVGGWRDGDAPATIALAPFWIARFPITVAQFAAFVAEGYGPGAEHWWTNKGWAWKRKRDRTEPWRWDSPPYHGPNQPVIGVTMHEAMAYCAWLTERMQAAGALPTGLIIRLPSEAEWETAASFAGSGERRPYPWGTPTPTPELAVYEAADGSNLGRPAPVGLCPAGAAACGALDMAGNVWEMCSNDDDDYPAGSHTLQKDFTNGVVPWRGGSWFLDETSVRCWARDRNHIHNDDNLNGFRVVVAPPLAHRF